VQALQMVQGLAGGAAWRRSDGCRPAAYFSFFYFLFRGYDKGRFFFCFLLELVQVVALPAGDPAPVFL